MKEIIKLQARDALHTFVVLARSSDLYDPKIAAQLKRAAIQHTCMLQESRMLIRPDSDGGDGSYGRGRSEAARGVPHALLRTGAMACMWEGVDFYNFIKGFK